MTENLWTSLKDENAISRSRANLSSTKAKRNSSSVAKEDTVKKCLLEYEKAIQQVSDGNSEEAYELFDSLLEEPILRDVINNDLEFSHDDSSFLRRLSFHVHKNAALFFKQRRLMKRFEDAMNVALSINCDDSELWFRLGEIYRDRFEYDNAISCFQAGCKNMYDEFEESRNDFWAKLCLRHLCETQHFVGDVDSSLQTCLQCSSLNPDDPYAKGILGNYLTHHSNLRSLSFHERIGVLSKLKINDENIVKFLLYPDLANGITTSAYLHQLPISLSEEIHNDISVILNLETPTISNLVVAITDKICNSTGQGLVIPIHVNLKIENSDSTKTKDTIPNCIDIRTSSRIQKIAIFDSSKAKQNQLLGDEKCSYDIENEFPELFFDELNAMLGPNESQEFKEKTLICTRRIIFLLAENVLNDCQKAKQRKRQRKESPLASGLPDRQAWKNFVLQYMDCPHIPDISGIMKIPQLYTLLDMANMAVKYMLLQHLSFPDRLYGLLIAEILTSILFHDSLVFTADISILLDIPELRKRFPSRLECLIYVTECITDSVAEIDLIITNYSEVNSQYGRLIKMLLDCIAMEMMEFTFQQNIRARYFMCCAQYEKFIKNSTNASMYTSLCMKELGSCSYPMNACNKLERGLLKLQAQIQLNNIESKIIDNELSTPLFQLIESIVFELKDFGIMNRESYDDSEKMIINMVSSYSLPKKMEICGAFLTLYESRGPAKTWRLRKVWLFCMLSRNLFLDSSLHDLFLNQWPDVDEVFVTESKISAARNCLALLVESFQLLRDLCDDVASPIWNDDLPSDFKKSVSCLLLVAIDIGLRFEYIEKYIKNAEEEAEFAPGEDLMADIRSIEKLLQLIPAVWVVFYQMTCLKSLDDTKKFILLCHIHDFLGFHGGCRHNNGILLEQLVEQAQSLLSKNIDICENWHVEDELFQAYNCLYGIRVTTDSAGDLENHALAHQEVLKINSDMAAKIYIVLRPYLLERLDRRDTYETIMSLHDSIAATIDDYSSKATRLHLYEFLNAPFNPTQDFGHTAVVPVSLNRQSKLWKDLDLKIAHESIHFVKAQILLNAALKMPLSGEIVKKRIRIEAFKIASEAFLLDLSVNINRWESWYCVGLCKCIILEELTSLVEEDIRDEIELVIESQRVSFRSFRTCIELINGDQTLSESQKTLILILCHSELGHLVYSMVSTPLCGIVSLRAVSRKLVIDEALIVETSASKTNFTNKMHDRIMSKISANIRGVKYANSNIESLPANWNEAHDLRALCQKNSFYTYAAYCFSQCRKLHQILVVLLGRYMQESFEWAYMLGKCYEKLSRDANMSLKYYRLSVKLSCSDWFLELNEQTSSLHPPNTSKLSYDQFSVCSFKGFSNISDIHGLPTSLSFFSSWRKTFTSSLPNAPIEPLYKYVTFLMKSLIVSSIIMPNEVLKHIQELKIPLAIDAESLWQGYSPSDTDQVCMAKLLTLMEAIKKYDRWYHRAIYRHVWFLRQFIKPRAKGNHLQFTYAPTWQNWASQQIVGINVLFQLKSKLFNFWRTPYERLGRYNVYCNQYLDLLIDCFSISKDYGNLLALFKRKSKICEVLWYESIFARISDEYSKMFENEINEKLYLRRHDMDTWWMLPGNVTKKAFNRCIPVLENVIMKLTLSESQNEDSHIRCWIEDEDARTPGEILDLMGRVVEVRKTVNSELLDRYLAELYSFLLIRIGLFECWISQCIVEFQQNSIVKTAENDSIDETIVEIDKPMSALLFWLFNRLREESVPVHPSLIDIESVLTKRMRSDAKTYMKGDDDLVDAFFLSQKSFALLRSIQNQKIQ